MVNEHNISVQTRTSGYRRLSLKFESTLVKRNCKHIYYKIVVPQTNGEMRNVFFLTLYTSEKKPDPIFVRAKSSTEYSADTAVFSAKHDGPVTRRSDDGTFWIGGGPGPLCSFTSIPINSVVLRTQ